MLGFRHWRLCLVPQVLILLSAQPAPAQPTEAKVESARARRGPFRAVYEADAVLVPANASELSFSPRALTGELRIAEVVPHGATVRSGDVVLRLEEETARDALRGMEWAVQTAERSVADARMRHQEHDADSERDLARAEKDLAFAEKTLKGYSEVQRPLEKEEHQQGERSFKHGIADQEDEIAQLGKMYKEDQLTEETEEIVLKRSKRNLEEMKKRLDLFLKRHDFAEEYSEPQQLNTLENAVKDKQRGLRDLRRARETARVTARIEIEKAEHELASARRKLERLQADVEGLALRAPHDGIALHAAFDERVAVAPLRRHAAVAPHVALITVAHAGALKARFSLKEKDRYRIDAGMPVAVLPEALGDRRFAGSLEPVSGFPLPDNTWNGHVTFGHADARLLPLMKAKVTVSLIDSMDALTVPLSAVFRKGDQIVCYVKRPSPFGIAARNVVTGPDNGKGIVVLQGLMEGEEVLLQEPPQ